MARAQIATASKGGQDHTAAGGPRLSQGLCGGESITPRHFDIEQGDIRLRRQRGLHHLIPSCHFSHDLDVLFPAQQSRERTTHHCLVFR